MTWILYNVLLTVLSPAALGYLGYRLLIMGKSRDGWEERLGRAPKLGMPGRGGRVWLHAVSAGETAAAAPVARELRVRAPEVEVIVSSITPAGHAQAKRLIPEASAWFYFPFDFVPCVEMAVRRARPDVFVTVETEIWPNFLHAARRRGVHTALVNGRFSDRGFRRASRLRPLYRWALSSVERLAMQSALDVERGLALGAAPDRLQVVGNTKFDQHVPVLSAEQAAAARASFGWTPGRPVFLAGSTHPGEEEDVLDAYAAARTAVPDLALMIAPRHIERADEIEALIQRRGLGVLRRSRLEKAEGDDEGGGGRAESGNSTGRPAGPIPPCALPPMCANFMADSISETAPSLLPPPPLSPPSVVLLDTVGELAGLYALASVVFVGGSLVPKGGHDILQPLFHGKPTLFGPYMHNQRDMTALALGADAAIQVGDAAALAREVHRLLIDGAARDRLRAGAERLLRDNRGAAARSAAVILGLLEQARASGPGSRLLEGETRFSTDGTPIDRPKAQGLIAHRWRFRS